MFIVPSLEAWLDEVIVDTKCSDLALVYIKQVLVNPVQIDNSFVLEFESARQKLDFAKLQKLGDWSIFCLSLGFEKQHKQTIEIIGAKSYMLCHILMQCQWQIFDELAHNMKPISSSIKSSLRP